MDAVVRDFGDRNPREDPVIHFYELFLKEYDAEKRMQRGVFYTPRPVVSYIVRSVHAVLRSEFGLKDGLADTATWGEMDERHEGLRIPDAISPDQGFVQILDPATGTGTFLVEAIDIIHKTLVAKWKAQEHGETKIDALWNEYVPEHLLPRLHGYELLMAPYAIAHLKISLKLYETGYRFGSYERARVYLTNALESAQDFSQGALDFAIPALADEAQAVNEIKRDARFTVIIGNPPYSGHSANKGAWIRELLLGSAGNRRVENYFEVDGGSLNERNPKWLNNDYVKFIRLAHWQIECTDSRAPRFLWTVFCEKENELCPRENSTRLRPLRSPSGLPPRPQPRRRSSARGGGRRDGRCRCDLPSVLWTPKMARECAGRCSWASGRDDGSPRSSSERRSGSACSTTAALGRSPGSWT